MTWFSWFWLGWAVAFAISFAVVERAALKSKRTGIDTLSRNIQWLLTKRTPIRWISLGLWGAFAVWFAAHIWGSSL